MPTGAEPSGRRSGINPFTRERVVTPPSIRGVDIFLTKRVSDDDDERQEAVSAGL